MQNDCNKSAAFSKIIALAEVVTAAHQPENIDKCNQFFWLCLRKKLSKTTTGNIVYWVLIATLSIEMRSIHHWIYSSPPSLYPQSLIYALFFGWNAP